jgi:hypothetical protein
MRLAGAVVGVPAGAVEHLMERARTEDPAAFERWLGRAERVGFCARPIRLQGSSAEVDRMTGELRTVYDSAAEDDGTLLLACGDRRASVCPACAEVYRRDAWQMIHAGLAGGKGIPASVGAHPLVFTTFTAPSFGLVHSRLERGGRVQVCSRRDPTRRCAHGWPVGCWVSHAEQDPRLGAPICGDCYDTHGAVLWNALAPRLWSATTTYVVRALARHAGLSQRACRGLVRVRYVKVAEFQRRGLVHFHALIRLDGAPPAQDPGRLVAPPAGFTVDLLAAAVATGAALVRVPVPVGSDHAGPRPAVRWGREVDVRPVVARAGDRAAVVAGVTDADTSHDARNPARDANGWEDRVAGYLAKYTTKAAEALGLPNRRLRGRDLARLGRLGLSAHVAELVQAAWDLGGQPHLAGLHLRKWAHMLGFGGHFATKSRRFSVTLGALRQARVTWRRTGGQAGAVSLDAWDRPESEHASERVGWWAYIGRGYEQPRAAGLRGVARGELSAVA